MTSHPLTENVLTVSAKDRPSIRYALDHLSHELADAFGGYTRVAGEGAWMSPSGVLHLDPVAVYTIAAPHTSETRDTLRAIARAYCERSDEEAAYLRFADGTVEFPTI